MSPKPAKRKPLGISWLLLALLLISVYVLWVLPYQLGPRPVRLQFEEASQPR